MGALRKVGGMLLVDGEVRCWVWGWARGFADCGYSKTYELNFHVFMVLVHLCSNCSKKSLSRLTSLLFLYFSSNNNTFLFSFNSLKEVIYVTVWTLIRATYIMKRQWYRDGNTDKTVGKEYLSESVWWASKRWEWEIHSTFWNCCLCSEIVVSVVKLF